MVYPVATDACTANPTSLPITGFKPCGCRSKYSFWNETYAIISNNDHFSLYLNETVPVHKRVEKGVADMSDDIDMKEIKTQSNNTFTLIVENNLRIISD